MSAASIVDVCLLLFLPVGWTNRGILYSTRHANTVYIVCVPFLPGRAARIGTYLSTHVRCRPHTQPLSRVGCRPSSGAVKPTTAIPLKQVAVGTVMLARTNRAGTTKKEGPESSMMVGHTAISKGSAADPPRTGRTGSLGSHPVASSHP